jgi:hypothetical protein
MHLVVHKNPDEAVKLKCKELEDIRKKEGHSTYLRMLRVALRTDPWFAMRVALEWAWLDEDLVGHKLIKHVADNYGEDTGILLPRGHGKTLPMGGLITTLIVNNPEIAILELSRTEDNANKFGGMVSDILMYNDMYQEAFGRKYNPHDGFLPSSTAECRVWGKDGYTLPYRKGHRLDPTLLTIPLKGAKAGKHPDVIYLDDLTERENNHEAGWAEVKDIVQGLWFLLPPHGSFIWTATRWHDSDPIGMAYKGTLKGKQGPFKFLKMSCYEDDNPSKAPIYPQKKRWNMSHETGFSHKMLEGARNDPEFGQFFDAQMRNDPSPSDRATIDTRDIVIFDDENAPKNLGPIRLVGVEVTGGGLPIYTGLVEKVEQLHLSMPLAEINNPRKQGVEKADRIITALQPIVTQGRLYARKWMMGAATDTDTLQYELKRIRVAAHDDIADALHNVPTHLCKGITPRDAEEPLHVYMSVDLAWSDKKRSDFTVAMIVAVDHRANYWVLDYDRFKSSSPEVIHNRLIAYYQKWNSEQSPTQRRAGRNKPFACRY